MNRDEINALPIIHLENATLAECQCARTETPGGFMVELRWRGDSQFLAVSTALLEDSFVGFPESWKMQAIGWDPNANHVYFLKRGEPTTGIISVNRPLKVVQP